MTINKGSLYTSEKTAKQLRPKPYKVLVPLAYQEEAQMLLPLAETLVQEYGGELIILNTLVLPEGNSLSGAASQASRFRETLTSIMSDQLSITAQIITLVLSENDFWEGVCETAAREKIDLLLFAMKGPGLQNTSLGDLLDQQMDEPPCDLVVVRSAEGTGSSIGWKSFRRILMPVRGGPHSTPTLRIGYALAQKNNASITLLHVANQQTQEELFVNEFSPVIQELEHVTRSITAKGKVSEAILAESQNYDLVVMGAPAGSKQIDFWKSKLLDEVIKNISKTLIVVREYTPPANYPEKRDEPISVTRDRPMALVVDKWFAENTYHSREFADLKRLVTLKEEQNLTISLGLPALNEEKTVGEVIRTIKTALMDEFPLLDEMVLIDSGSQDKTCQIAEDMGNSVFIHQEILPQHKAFRGKGEALWKSLYVLKGEIIAWIDTDISNIHPRFVYGILGPLLRQPGIQYVKGFYRRPLREGDKLVAGSGGRVTELTARPFFNMFFPELSGLIQPLSGEYAGRRKALEQLPFFTGYGVETGLLIDLLEEYGLSGIAQVDLLERIHHNQPLPSLSKMSFAIMQVVIGRLEKRHQVKLFEGANTTMNLIRYGQRRRYYLEPEEVREFERPPMATLPEYYEKRRLQTKNITEGK